MEQTNKRAYLLSFTVSGVKNIENDMTLQFYDLTKPKTIDLHNNIKAIYGTNGSGKTAIVFAVRLLKEFILAKDILSSRYEALSNIVNKKTNSFHLQASFGIYDADNRKVDAVYSYETRINKKRQFFRGGERRTFFMCRQHNRRKL